MNTTEKIPALPLLSLCLACCSPLSAQVQQAWVARYPGPTNTYARAATMAMDPAGNVYVAGSSTGTNGNIDFLTVKYDSNGSQLWAVTFDGPSKRIDSVSALTIDSSGNVYVTGISDASSGIIDGAIATIKYDSNGALLWVARYQSSAGAVLPPSTLAVDSAGNVHVSSNVTLPSVGDYSNGDYLTIKYDSSGNQLWAVQYDGLGHLADRANAMAVDGAGNVYVTGGSVSSCLGIPEFGIRCLSDYATVKYDRNGQRIWVARYRAWEPSASDARAVAVDSAGHVYVTGSSSADFCGRSSAGVSDFCPADYATVAYDQNGNQLWAARYTSPVGDEDAATAIALDSAGNVLVTGWSTVSVSGDVGEEAVTIKYDPQGNELWTSRYVEPSHVNKPSALALDATDNVYIAGSSYGGTNTLYDFAVVKYDANGNQIWAAHYDGPDHGVDIPVGFAVDHSNNIYIAGSKSYGSGTSNPFTTVKYIQTPLSGLPTIASRPQSQSLTEGQNVTFSVTATGAEPLAYQWRLNGTNIPGATNITLSLSYVQAVQAGEYSVVVSNSVGVTVSAVARLMVAPLLQLSWLAAYGAEVNPFDSVNAMAVDNAGNIYVTGYIDTQANGDSDYATVKYDTHGHQLWAVRYNGTGNANDSALAIAVDKSGNVFVTGFSRGVGTGEDYATLKYGPTGNQLWVRRYNSRGSVKDRPCLSSLALDDAGNVYVTGSSGTLKYDLNGNHLWLATNVYANTFAGIVVGALAVDGAGNAYVTGDTYPPGRATAKYDSNGNQLWLSRSTNYFYASGVALDGLGNVYVTGDSALVKYGPNGNGLWTVRYTNAVPDFVEAWTGAAVDSAGNVFVAGYGRPGIVTLKYDADGHFQWAGRYAGPARRDDAPWAVALDGAGNVYVTGYVTVYTQNAPRLNYDFVTLKYDSAGHQLAAEHAGNSEDQQAYALGLDASGNVYVAGFSAGDGFVTAKYVQHPIPTRLGIATALTNGAVQLTLSSEAQRSYEIQVSADLTHWARATNVFNVIGTVGFQDIASGARRFYRAMKRDL